MAPRFRTLLPVWLLLFATGTVYAAESIESVLMPGKVIEGHAKYEHECSNCHMPFKKSAQRDLCLDCHKDVAKDVERHQGYHGRLEENDCRGCHTEHKGRDAKIAAFDTKKFDHKRTDYELKDAHTDPKIDCHDCHPPGRKYRDTSSDCFACHKKDDKHKGNLGPHCDDCHKSTRWKDTRFDHSKTRFALKGKHADVPCRDCHKDPSFKGSRMECIACHRKDDKHKGRYTAKCERCHNEKDWKNVAFDHDRETGYPLKHKHARTACDKCHTGDLFSEKDKPKKSCFACHKKDDKDKGHKGKFGEKCEACHSEKDWKLSLFDHNRDTKYALKGKHGPLKCDKCHSDGLYEKKLKTACFDCHEKDDKEKGHKNQLGKKCDKCHTERGWKDALYDHGLSRFPLLGNHAKAKCDKCHKSAAFKDTKSDCYSCHEKDDKHKLKLGPECELCHNPRNWKTWDFDHDKRTQFKLDGEHKGKQCEACHRDRMPQKVSLAGTCVSCHDEEDVHDGGFGKQCERCHVTTSFKNIKTRAGVAPEAPKKR